MSRRAKTLLLGILLASGVSLLHLPFRDVLFDGLMRMRGPRTPGEDIVIITPTSGASNFDSWVQDLLPLLQALTDHPPRLVFLDLEPDRLLLQDVVPLARKLPLVWHFSYGHRGPKPAGPLPQLLPSPDGGEEIRSAGIPEISVVEDLDVYMLSKIAPNALREAIEAGPRLVNVPGPSGTFRHIQLRDLRTNPERTVSLQGKILLLAPPLEFQHARVTSIPFYARGGAGPSEEIEIHAIVLENVLRGNSIVPLSGFYEVLLTFGVSILTVFLLFATTPIVGILAVILVTFLLLMAALFFVSHGMYLDVLLPLYAIGFAYYFLIPYRLIIEYKARWRYQEENRLMAEVETLKNNFMSLVSHNLKTPIARIQGAVEGLLSSPPPPDAVEPTLNLILRSTEELNRFISRILNLARVESPEYQLRIAAHDVNQIVEGVLDSHQALAKEKNVTLRAELEPLFPVSIDGELIKESIANLVENAVKYTPPEGDVKIQTQEIGPWVQIRVHDSGPGIPQEEQNKVFSKFFRGAATRNKGIRGSGLGLYLVRYFVELHGGTVEVHSSPGSGSTFAINLLRK